MTSVIVRPEGEIIVTQEPDSPVVVQRVNEDLVVVDGPAGSATVVHPSNFALVDPPADPAQVTGSGNDVVVISLGPKGPAGPTGPAGPDGRFYTHEQTTPSASWTVQHDLGRYVSVDVYVDDHVGLADIEAIDLNTLSITFPSAVSGIAAIR